MLLVSKPPPILVIPINVVVADIFFVTGVVVAVVVVFVFFRVAFITVVAIIVVAIDLAVVDVVIIVAVVAAPVKLLLKTSEFHSSQRFVSLIHCNLSKSNQLVLPTSASGDFFFDFFNESKSVSMAITKIFLLIN